jgi:hypothetical protein
MRRLVIGWQHPIDGPLAQASPYIFAVATVICAGAYLAPFIDRGWIPHDEGTIAGDALRLIQGELPHVGFQDPYIGGMTWFYAALFRLFGVDLVTIRGALYGAALLSTFVWYCIASHFARPLPAAAAALVALVWGYPNYFAGLPSWWVLLFASLAVLGLMRFHHTGRTRWLFSAGLMLGLACVFKQPAVYAVAAAWLAVAYYESLERPAGTTTGPGSGFVLRLVGVSMILLGLAVLIGFHVRADVWVVLVLPIATLALFVAAEAWRYERHGKSERSDWRLLGWTMILAAGVAIPLTLLLVPYACAGQLGPFVYGTFVLPQLRTDHAGFPLQPPIVALGLVPYLAVVLRLGLNRRPGGLEFIAAWVLPAAAVLGCRSMLGYYLTWNAVRYSLLAIVPLVLVALSRTSHSVEPARRADLFLVAAMGASMALFQYPFAAPIYFCYAAPLIILALFGAVRLQNRFGPVHAIPIFAAIAAFAVLSANRGYGDTIGAMPEVRRFDHPLNIPRAHLLVGADDVSTYSTVVKLVQDHGRGPFIHAFPDCPEVYFLTGRRNPTPANFDFFYPLSVHAVAQLWRDRDIDLIVINHLPRFSPTVSAAQLASARRAFPAGVRVRQFEVRWREP